SHCHRSPRNLLPFPTRRSSDLFEDADPSLPPTGPGTSPRVDSDGRLLVPTTGGLAIRQGSRFHLAGRSAGVLPPVYSVLQDREGDRKSTRLNSSHGSISYAVFC